MFSFQLCQISKNTYLYRTTPVAASENLRFIVILSKHMLLYFCVLPAQLLDVIRSGTLLCGVTTRNSAPIPSSTRNRNSTRVGAVTCVQVTFMVVTLHAICEGLQKNFFVLQQNRRVYVQEKNMYL